MKLSRRTKAIAAVAGAASIAIIAAGCSPSSDSDDDGGKVELTLATFNDFGYTDELLQEYMDENPNVTIVHNRAATSNDARANYFQKLGKEGLADIEAVEVDWFTEAMQYSDLLAEVPADAKGRWLDWKEAAATDADGRLVGFGTDIGPQGVCYRSDLFAAAGLPTGREEVAALLDGDWDNFFNVADQYKAATGKPFIDSANSVLQGLVNQLETAYEEPDGTIVATENPDIEDAYNTVVERAVPISAYAGQWSDDWFASMANGEFAAMLCPGWMHGVISGNAPERHRLGRRRRLPRRRRQLGRLVPHGAGQRRERRRGAQARRLADRSRAAGQGVRERGHLPEPDRRLRRRRPHRLHQRVLQRRTDR